MDDTYWHKQTKDALLFPKLVWSRPENRSFAGKLLIIGGNVHGFAAAGEAFAEADKAGIGVTRVVLPDSLQKTVGRAFEAGEYAPSTPSGSFSQKALAELLADAAWADGVLVAGDLGRNSETAILLEKFANKYTGLLTLTKDAADYVISAPQNIVNRPNTTLVISLAQLQKLGVNAHFPIAFTFTMDLLRLVDALHKFTHEYSCNVIVKHLDNIFTAVDGEVSTTKLMINTPIWRVTTAAHASVWWLQNTSQPFAALTTACVETEAF